MKLAICRSNRWIIYDTISDDLTNQEIANFLADKVAIKSTEINEILVVSVDKGSNPIVSKILERGSDYS